MIVGLDFDGTLCEHRFPDIGKDIGAWPWLVQASALGARYVLITMRSEEFLDAAVEVIRARGIELYGVQVTPGQEQWTSSPKAYCHVYVGDETLGAPLVHPMDGGRPYVDWEVAGPLLVARVREWEARQEAIWRRNQDPQGTDGG